MKILSTLLLSAMSLSAATYCVGPAATGGGSGADWSHLKAWSDTPARGDTWYLETGSYAGNTFNTANSGTTLITIKKAIPSDHVTDTGWVSSMANQATFTGIIYFGSSYWTIDGQVGGGASTSPPDTTATDYGFASSVGDQCFGISVPGVTIQNLTINHVYALATSSDTEKEWFYGYLGGGSYAVNNLTISYCYLDGWQGALMTKGQGSHPYTGFVFQYNLCFNGFSSSANHGEWINPNEQPLTGAIIRYNIFKGYSGSAGMTGTIVANNSSFSSGAIYGNVFDGVKVGNGGITGTSAGSMSSTLVYNNTFLNFTGDSGAWLGGLSGQGSGNVGENNLVYNMPGSIGAIWTSDYDAFYSASGNPGESHQQTASGNPFTSYSTGNYSLTANTTGGANLGSPYNVDALGNTRSTWTRGAFEYSSGSTSNPPSITSQPVSQKGVTNAAQTFTVSATGSGTLMYQWKLGGTNVSGATASSWTSTPVSAATNQVAVGITNAYGGLVSDGTAYLDTTNGVTPPSITTPLSGGTNSVANGVLLSVSASGDMPLTYQFRLAGSIVQSSTGFTSYTVTTTNQNGQWDCRVTNAWGMVTSGPVSVVLTNALATNAPGVLGTMGPRGRWILLMQ